MSGEASRYPKSLGRPTLARGRPTFLTRTATDDAAQLFRRASLSVLSHDASSHKIQKKAEVGKPDEPTAVHSQVEARQRGTDGRNTLGTSQDGTSEQHKGRLRSSSRTATKHNIHIQTSQSPKKSNGSEKLLVPKTGTVSRPSAGSEKLGTFSGVFVPTSLNVLSILMFIRWGFILGQGGVIGMMGMLVAAYLINLVTTMSISAVASNGTVRGGGAYYLISRSLGPEFGGSIGIVFYLGFVFNTGMNAVGLIDCLNYNFGSVSGNWSTFMPEGFWWQYLWSTVVLLICTAICLAGSSIFARASNGLLMVVLIATLSIPLSALVLRPFLDPKTGIQFTGLNAGTFRENLMPRFTKHAAGSQLDGRENFQDLFGILFPATGGIFAGASMSGDLKNPSKSIPRGTLYGLALTFFSYTLVILAMAGSITRVSFYNNVNVIQDTNMSGTLILLGEFATTFFSTLMGVIGPAKLLQAIARDSVLPGLSLFGQGTQKSDEPVYAILITWAAAQVTMLFDINRIASFITMTYLMTFFVTNLACFLLKLSSAPNFRPSFHYFNWWTAAAGAAASVAAMFFVDGAYATGSIGVLIFIFLLIHYTTPPKAWGDVSQSLIYHQVRKYLLRLRQHEHVKFWRPQILLFVNDPRRGYKLIQFCNSLKKGALFILGHVIVTSNFGASVPEVRRQQAAWNKYIDFSHIKAFVNVAVSPSIEWGTRNIVLSAGLGGMRPNIVIMGFYNIQQFRQEQPLVDVPSPPPERKHTIPETTGRNGQHRSKNGKRSKGRAELEGALPTDTCYVESRTDVQSYVMVLEDMLLKMQINVAVATGFQELELPNPKEGNTKKFIDLWPIQMSAQFASEEGDVLTTNFDTYTLILQLGCILHTVPSWKESYNLRVAVFVEYESDVEEERSRVAELLENLRIEAEILVFWLASGDVKSYQVIVNGDDTDAEAEAQVEKVLEDEDWWRSIKKIRGKVRTGETSAFDELSAIDDANAWPASSFQERDLSVARYDDRLRHLIRTSRRRQSFGNLSGLGVSFGMRTHRLNDDMLSRHASHASASEVSDSDETQSDDSNAVEGASDEEESIDLSETASERDTRSINLHTSSQDHSPGDLDNSQSRHPSTPKTHSKKGSLSSKKSRSSKKDQSLLSGVASEAPELSKSNLQALDLAQTQADKAFRKASPDGSEKEPPRGRPGVPHDAPDVDAVDFDERSPHRLYPDTNQRQPSRSRSPGNFTSSPVPKTTVANDDIGPSIMFVDEPKPPRTRPTDLNNSGDTHQASRSRPRSIYQRNLDNLSTGGAASASGFPASAAVPLSFNDLPSRAQHLILNELITQQSEDTAVVFTTLPAPVEGTYRSESDSLGYVSDLEVLCGGLPPTLMVHSNSMTVTMNL